jgi:hypothetical protein
MGNINLISKGIPVTGAVCYKSTKTFIFAQKSAGHLYNVVLLVYYFITVLFTLRSINENSCFT